MIANLACFGSLVYRTGGLVSLMECLGRSSSLLMAHDNSRGVAWMSSSSKSLSELESKLLSGLASTMMVSVSICVFGVGSGWIGLVVVSTVCTLADLIFSSN